MRKIKIKNPANVIECKNGDFKIDFEENKPVFCEHMNNDDLSLLTFDWTTQPIIFVSVLNRLFALSECRQKIMQLFSVCLGCLLFSANPDFINWVIFCRDKKTTYSLMTILKTFIPSDRIDKINICADADGLNRCDLKRKIIIPIYSACDTHISIAEIEHIIQSELPGILRLAADGFISVLKKGKIDEPAECIALRKTKNKRHIDNFIESNCRILSEYSGMKTKTIDVYNAYKKWRDPWGQFLGRNNFYAELKKTGVILDRDSNIGMYCKNLLIMN